MESLPNILYTQKLYTNRLGIFSECIGGGKICFEGEAMGLMVLHGWRG